MSRKLQSESWREAENHKPYDLEPDLRSSLKASGIDIVDEMQEGNEARLLIAYKERKGESYGAIGSPGKTVDFGTVISLGLTMISPVGKTLLEVQASCRTPFSVEGTSLYQAALDELKSEPLYKKVGLWVLAGLGSSEALRQLLSVVVDKRYREDVEASLDSLLDSDDALPSGLWDPEAGSVGGGVNYSKETDGTDDPRTGSAEPPG